MPTRAARLAPIVLLVAACSSGTSGTAPPVDMAVPPPAPDLSLSGPPVVDKARFDSDLSLVARVRSPGSEGWQAIQDLCFGRLSQLGYETTRERYATGINVVGVKKGALEPDKKVVVSAHYDHIKDCIGADDNGSGMAGLFEAARVLAAAPHDRTLIIACWDEEERGLIGSKAWAAEAKTRGDQIEMAYVFETMAFKSDEPNSQTLPAGFDAFFPDQVKEVKANQQRGDFIAAIFDDQPQGRAGVAKAAEKAKAISLPLVALPVPFELRNEALLSDLRRSDHAAFWLQGYPAVFFTDTANFRNPYYHCRAGQDTIDHLDTAFATKVVVAAVAGAEASLKKP